MAIRFPNARGPDSSITTRPLVPDAEGVLTGPAAPAISRLEDLSGQEICVQQNTAIWNKLVAPSEEFRKAGKAPVEPVAADHNLLEDDIAQAVSAVGETWGREVQAGEVVVEMLE